MGNLIYSMITSLDGYVSDEVGDLSWGIPDEEFYHFLNQHTRDVGTYLYGRKMYEAMVYWETAHLEPDQPPHFYEWANMWRAADKIVYSTTLIEPGSDRTRIERTFDATAVRDVMAATDKDLTITGPHLAAHALRAGIVGEVQLYVTPIILGGGNRFFLDDVRLELELLDQHRFSSGVVYLRYKVNSST